MYRSKAYLSWIKAADQLFLINKKGPIRKLIGPFVAVLELYTTDKRCRRDADNRLKAPLDYCVRLGLVEDDSKAEIVVAGWVSDSSKAPHGAVLTIYPYKKEGLPDVLTALAVKFGE